MRTILILLTAIAVSPSAYAQVKDFDSIKLYTLENESGMTVRVTNYGAIITSIIVPDRSGKRADIALGYNRVEDYGGDLPGDPHSNVFIGRCWAHLNNTPFRKYKHYNHEGGTASPLIAHWPAAVKPRTEFGDWITTPTHLVDIMATCVDLGAATYPSEFTGNSITPAQGQSLRPLLTGDGEFASRPLFWEHEGNAAIRVGDRKLVRLGVRGDWELYDLKLDRTEQNDLAKDHPAEVTSLAKQWRQWAKSADVLPKPEPKSKTKKRKAVPK